MPLHNNAPSSVPSYDWAGQSAGRQGASNGIHSKPAYSDSFSSSSVDVNYDRRPRPLKPGIYVPTVAFFKEVSEDLDTDTIASHAVRMARAGVAGLATQGSNGEAVHLSHQERHLVTKTTREALNEAGFSHIPIIVGCGAQSTRETIILCEEAAASGGDYVLVLPPAYYKGLYKPQFTIEFFSDVATASPIPVLIYNFPGAAAGIDIDSDVIIELAKHPNIVGCKLTCGNTGKLNRIAAAARASNPLEEVSGFMCMGGSADFTMQTLIGGGSGVICGLANIAPKACVKIIELYKAGKFVEAQNLQAVVARGDWAAIQGGVVGTKSGLLSHFGYGGYGRKPLPRPTKPEISKYAEGFEELVAVENVL
ncbi:uncharacterized protein PADG_03024 [Paracoccidioides brasiliensis Pb18]|uniref:Dihydrodipicolinate synthase n=1 Tax=Paracoccidioides brasiliensis (strain Pb18) TaxID=502780 RepID=C1G769_PARBD|nr:uncharacterized protein PADG_03024 [Paracoccidioides brasiliensis Pb18]EEH46926.1 hypothetical protein PADG_03024 [Paracoccidioides brasiliensis Pb18]